MKVRVLRRASGWHWWCPCCMGGDYETASLGGGWQSTYTWILAAALDHVRWHAERDRRERERMTTMTTLTEFLLARIADDEAVAQACIDDTESWGNPYASGASAEFADRFGPARVLAECAAKRQLVERIQDDIEHTDHQPDNPDLSWFADELLGLLALPYADHPAYRDEWRP